MKTKVLIETEIEISTVKLELPVNYGSEEMPTGFPGRNGDTWKVTIDIDSGQIKEWPAGREPFDLHLTVKDGGSYYLNGPDGKQVGCIEENYVPHELIPGDYGDVVRFQIDANGLITNWPKDPRVCEFFDND